MSLPTHTSLIDLLDEPATWAAFYAEKTERSQLTRAEAAELEAFIASAGYRPVVQRIRDSEASGLAGGLTGGPVGGPAGGLTGGPVGGGLSVPRKKLISKLGTSRKRTVYSFAPEEMWVLKLLAHLLFAYDDRQPLGCYSFRRGQGAHRAIRTITRTPGIDKLWCYKVDVADYFNSIPFEKLLPILAEVLADDQPLLAFFAGMLSSDQAVDAAGQLLREPRGVMAGTPTSPFLANLYLRDLDAQFAGRGLPYARYSDDIIVFNRSREALERDRSQIAATLRRLGLRVNPAKEQLSGPGEPWEFLGISYRQGCIDLAPATLRKLKGKIRRRARALRRWMLRKQPSPGQELTERAMCALIRAFNRKFFEPHAGSELCWSRWFFPLLTESRGLAAADAHLQQYIRYLGTGRFSHANYRTGYADLKRLGYRSLVHEFYAWRQ